MPAPKELELDPFDRKILDLLQDNNRLSQRDIGRAVHLSPSAVNRRIAAMEEAGVILANAAVVDPERVGRPITIIAEVSVESERLELLDRVRRSFLACEQVQQVYYVAGHVDFVLILAVKDMAEYEMLTRRLFFAEANVKRFTTLVAMSRARYSLKVPAGG